MDSGVSAGEATPQPKPPPQPPPPQQPPAPRPSPADKEEKSKETFREDVRTHFTILVAQGQGLEPNDAAALALKLAAKIGARRRLPKLNACALEGSSPVCRAPEKIPTFLFSSAPSLPLHFNVVTTLSLSRAPSPPTVLSAFALMAPHPHAEDVVASVV